MAARAGLRLGVWPALLAAWIGPVPAAGHEVTLDIEPRWSGVLLPVPSPELAASDGQHVRVTRLAALIGEVVLHRTDGSEVRLEGQHGFFDAAGGRRRIRLGAVPAGEYDGLSVVVGVPAAVNHADPGRWPPGHPLHPLVNGLHWSWQGGYVFTALEGHWRAAGEGSEQGFLYHLATEALRRRVTFRSGFRVAGDHEVRLAWDVARAFRGRRIDPGAGSDSTHSAAGDVLAPQLAEALARGWFWLGDAAVPAGAGAPAGNPGSPAPPGTPVAFVVPGGFPQPNLPADNPLTREGVELGRRLFADSRLSRTGTQACVSCHHPGNALADRVALSRGLRGATGPRNAMPLFNLAWSPAFGWDGGQARVRDQALAAWRHPLEMDTEPAAVADELARDPTLASLAHGAFGAGGLTVERILLALEQYLLTEVSADSRFDRARRGEAALTAPERRGLELFMTEHDPARGQRGADCFHCHGGALFTDFGFRRNGLAAEGSDRGRGEVTGRAEDGGRFKTPSLRNVALTAPYLHDGSVATLEEVVARYDHGVIRSPNLDPSLAKHPPAGLSLSVEDQAALVAFLRALTDPRLGAGSTGPAGG